MLFFMPRWYRQQSSAGVGAQECSGVPSRYRITILALFLFHFRIYYRYGACGDGVHEMNKCYMWWCPCAGPRATASFLSADVLKRLVLRSWLVNHFEGLHGTGFTLNDYQEVPEIPSPDGTQMFITVITKPLRWTPYSPIYILTTYFKMEVTFMRHVA